jgi:FemAB-related protein (PEP-CTERM system-associated)
MSGAMATVENDSLRVSVAEAPGPGWDEFVRDCPGASIYLRSRWSLLARDVFRHRVFFIEARGTQGLEGVLPIVQQRSLFGNFATSMPFFNYGGALAREEPTAIALMGRARDLARELGCSYLELRDVKPRAPDWEVRTDKASMILELPASQEALGRKLGSKLRSQIKRADREVVAVRHGGAELLDAFYDVFCRNMRDLGTPVYPKKFFAAILERFGAETQLLVIERAAIPVAAGFLVFDERRAEIPWAACRADAKPLGMNMKLYWEALSLSISRGSTSFDFGRSTVDSGTYRFKKQWGAEPLPLHWHRWERRPKAASEAQTPAVQAGAAGSGRLMRIATAVWQRLPLPVANTIGPWVSPGLPW